MFLCQEGQEGQRPHCTQAWGLPETLAWLVRAGSGQPLQTRAAPGQDVRSSCVVPFHSLGRTVSPVAGRGRQAPRPQDLLVWNLL